MGSGASHAGEVACERGVVFPEIVQFFSDHADTSTGLGVHGIVLSSDNAVCVDSAGKNEDDLFTQKRFEAHQASNFPCGPSLFVP
jgi:hypothetical protein